MIDEHGMPRSGGSRAADEGLIEMRTRPDRRTLTFLLASVRGFGSDGLPMSVSAVHEIADAKVVY